MKFSSVKLVLAAIIVMIFAACQKKVDDLPSYKSGVSPTLSSSVAATVPLPGDSLKPVLTLNWSWPFFASDSTTAKYVVEIDSTGRNFSKSVSKTVTRSLSTSYTAKELNDILLGYGFAFNTGYDMDIRITASYGNNNDQTRSNTIKVKMTPYKIPPKVVPPTSGKLFLVGDASQGGWNNPVPVPTQEFTKIDSVTYGGIFNLVGGKQYLALPVNGDWTNKFAVADNTISGLSGGGAFGYNQSQNFPGPATSGWYKILFDFQAGKFTVTPYTGVLPTNLFIVGDATAGGWNNPVPVPSQQLTRDNSSQWSVTLPFIGGKQYLLLPVNGDWSNKYAVAGGTVPAAGGDFGYNLSTNFNGPATSGTYKLTVNFVTGQFKLN
ncbi:MAG: SusE domain-containing protein [Chitinophagaceae bacterium]